MFSKNRKSNLETVRVGDVLIGAGEVVFIAGPCVIESREHALHMADILSSIASTMGIPLVFKSSYDKANRSSIHSFRGPGLDEGLAVLSEIKEKIGVPILTDVHAVDQIAAAAQVVDIIQIPAFLCRQTDLYIEAGKHNIPVNIKKGQFLAPGDMKNVLEKARVAGIEQCIFTERGVTFGYNRLVVDFTALPIMRQLGVPVIFDGTHSLQLPGGGGDKTTGRRDFVAAMCRAAVAVGCDGVFLEVHDDPPSALSDADNMITPETFRNIVKETMKIRGALNGQNDA